MIVPPIKCQGIKTRLTTWILSQVGAEGQGRWLEPFMGSGVVGFNRQPKRAVFGDMNPHLIRFYQAMQQEQITPRLVRDYLAREGLRLRDEGESHYYGIRERFNQTQDSLDFLFLSRAAFNGVMRFNRSGKFNVPFCKNPDRFAPSHVTRIANQIAAVGRLMATGEWHFASDSFQKTIAKARKGDWIYCDPPYFGRNADYFNQWTEMDERELHRLLAATKARFILSTWRGNQFRTNPWLATLWSDFHVVTREHCYHVGARISNRHPMIEALVMNFTPTIP